jgi:hypothetical protein
MGLLTSLSLSSFSRPLNVSWIHAFWFSFFLKINTFGLTTQNRFKISSIQYKSPIALPSHFSPPSAIRKTFFLIALRKVFLLGSAMKGFCQCAERGARYVDSPQKILPIYIGIVSAIENPWFTSGVSDLNPGFQHFFQEKTTPFHEPIGNLRDISSGLILWDLRVVIFKFSAFSSDAIRNISGWFHPAGCENICGVRGQTIPSGKM